MSFLLDDRYPRLAPRPSIPGGQINVQRSIAALQEAPGKKMRSQVDTEAADGRNRPANNLVVMRLKQLGHLSDSDQSELLSAFDAPRKASPKSSIDRGHDQASSVRFIQQGFAYRYIGLPDGRQQITSLLLPGDTCDSLALAAPNTEHGICALTTVIYSEIKRPTIESLIESNPRIAMALWRSFLLNEAMLYERIASLGQRSAKERLAHFLCEVFFRCRAVGLTSGMQCNLPLSQGDLGDTLGLSLVHTNRSLMALRADRLITLESRLLTIVDLARLQETAHFNPRYLQLAPDVTAPVRHASNTMAFDHPHRNAHI